MTGYQAYQGNQVEGAGPLGLVLLTYDALYKALGRARLSVEAGNMEAEAENTARAMEAIIELSSSLNMEKGGEVAEGLAKLYFYMTDRLTQGMCSKSCDHLDEIISLVQTLREGWQDLQQGKKQQIRPVARAQTVMPEAQMMMAQYG